MGGSRRKRLPDDGRAASIAMTRAGLAAGTNITPGPSFDIADQEGLSRNDKLVMTTSATGPTTVVETLTSVRQTGRPVYYFPNGGNAGDALINLGFYEVARTIGLEYEEINRSKIGLLPKDAIAIIAGGGALVPEWDDTPETVHRLVAGGIQGVILPHSIRGTDDLVKSLPETWTVFCREKMSHRYCLDLNPAAAIRLDHDMAFHLNAKDLVRSALPKGKFLSTLTSGKNILRYGAIALIHARSAFTSTLFAFRCDKEARTGLAVPRRKFYDLSAVARFGSSSAEDSAYSAAMLLKLIDRHDTIHTDRLHVAIGASLLGKDTTIYSNSYYKLDAVYDMSLRTYPRTRRSAS